jgi:hypothetical protein
MPLQSFVRGAGSERYTAMRSNVTLTSGSITSGGTIGVYTTTPVQFVASTAYDTSLIRVTCVAAMANSGARSDVVLDLMAGAGGSEYSIATLIFGARPAYSSYTLPIQISSGTRLSGRVAAGVASRASLTFSVDYWNRPDMAAGALPSRWVAYGMTVTSGTGAYGTAITAGSTNAWSSWTSLTASTTYPHEVWLPMIGCGNQTAITAVNYRAQFAIASTTDAATMVTNTTGIHEVPMLTGNTTESLGQYATATNPVHIGLEELIYAPRPTGSAVSARVMCSGTATSGTTTCAILGGVK